MSSTDPNLGLTYGWTLGESGWDTGMDANLKRLGATVGLSVKDRDLTTPPVLLTTCTATAPDAVRTLRTNREAIPEGYPAPHS